MNNKLANTSIWITGASSGIGEGLAYVLAQRGARLILSARRRERLETVRSACMQADHHLVVPLDLADPASLTAAADQVLSSGMIPDIVIHNGGISQRALVTETELDVDRQLMDVNYFGPITLTKALLPKMLERGSGHFVVISSMAGKFGVPKRSAYAAAKHALHGFFDTVRAELYNAGIRVTVVCPGYIHTDLSLHALVGDGSKHNIMDTTQANGMTVAQCAKTIVRAIEKEKAEVYMGGKEVLGVYLKRFAPGVLNRILRNRKS